MNYRSTTLLAGLLSVTAQMQAQDLKEEPGWAFALNLNVGYAYQQSQFNTDDDNEVTHNLNSSGKNTDSLFILPLYRIEYTLDNLNTQFYLGNTDDNVARGRLMDELGFVHRLDNETVLTIAYAFNDDGTNETWKDPYLIGQKRKKTDETTEGGRIRVDYIGGLPVSLEYGFSRTEVDNEKSGTSLALSAQQRQHLRRDADMQWVTMEGFLPIDDSIAFLPGLFYNESDAKGTSNSYNRYGVNLTMFATFQRQFISANISYSKSDHDVDNPVFNKTQNDKTLSAFVSYGYERPFGWQDTIFTVFSGWNDTRSSIVFFESKGAFASAGLGYQF